MGSRSTSGCCAIAGRSLVRLGLAALLGVGLVAFPGGALAQTGAYGGSSGFGSGGSSSSSSSSGSSSSGSSSGSSGSSSSGGSSSEPPAPRSAIDFTPPAAALGDGFLAPRVAIVPEAESKIASSIGSPFTFFCSCLAIFTLVFGGLGSLGWVRTKPKPADPRERFGARTGHRGELELRRLSIAFDWTARADLQRTLEPVTRSAPDASDDDRRRMLNDVVHLLLEKVPAARYAAQQALGKSWSDAEPAFLALTSQLRSRYRIDTRGQGALDAVPELVARADEGQGFVVVSLVVCAVGALSTLPGRVDRLSVERALRGTLTPPTARIVAIQVIWSPAEENDRMSSAELEVLYPELLRVDSGSDIGRVQCAYCSAVFPAEIGRCPACGAPGPSPAGSGSPAAPQSA